MERRPATGLRVLFERAQTEEAYRVSLCSPDSVWQTSVAFGANPTLGEFERIEGDAELEPWMRDVASNFLRTLAKNHAELADWPRRVSRWRAPR
jgi:hypothetical protein